jgi:cytochrome c biogenesis protein CcmG/thiol:disulfide interchange protein DsbE
MIKIIAITLIILCMVPVCASSGQIGTMAPAFRLIDLNGQAVTSAQFKGKVVFLGFWAIWCKSCREELPELNRLYMKFNEKGFTIIGISVDSSQARVAAFLKKVPVTFPILIDQKGDVAESYRLSGLPAGFLIDKNGIIRQQYKGFAIDLLPLYEKDISDLLKQ